MTVLTVRRCEACRKNFPSIKEYVNHDCSADRQKPANALAGSGQPGMTVEDFCRLIDNRTDRMTELARYEFLEKLHFEVENRVKSNRYYIGNVPK